MNQPMAVFFDIDGTLLPDWKETIPEENMRAIHAAQARGHLCILNTGRAMGAVDRHLPVADFDGIISGVGTRAAVRGEVLWEDTAPPEESRRVIDAARACGVKVILESNTSTAYDTSFFSPTEADLAGFADYHKVGRHVTELGENDSFPFAKFILSPEYGGDSARFLAMMSDYDKVDYGNGWYEVVPKGHGKGVAMLRVLEHLGMTPEQSIAVGDSENDVPMLCVTPNSVAMGNGTAKNYPVSFVTLECRAGGIPHMMRHFGLID